MDATVRSVASLTESDIPQLDTTEREALAAEWQRLQAEPPPRDRRAVGCMTMLVAIGLGIAAPPLGRLVGVEPSQPVKLGIGIALGLVFLAGLIVGVFTGSGRFAHALTRAEQAIEWLAANASQGDALERRRQAVALLLHAYCTDGPSTVHTIDFGRARERLGAALPYVIAAERALRRDVGIYPVFTDSEPTPPG